MIDLGLAILATKEVPPQGRSVQEIAAYCDCDPRFIKRVSASALNKVRAALADPSLPPSARPVSLKQARRN